MSDDSIKDASPYPSAAEMDLDIWRASRPDAFRSRRIIGADGAILAVIPTKVGGNADRDVMARRIEAMGDLYEALRRAAERMIEAGMDVSDEHRALTEFVSPKPFAKGA